MIRLEHTVVIYRPVGEVFAFVGDPCNDPQWSGAITDATRTSGEGPMADTAYEVHAKFLGRRLEVSLSITVCEPPQRICFEGRGPISWTDCRTLEPTADGDTRLTRTVEADVGGFFGMVEALAHGAAQKQVETDLTLLKTLLDARAERAAE